MSIQKLDIVHVQKIVSLSITNEVNTILITNIDISHELPSNLEISTSLEPFTSIP